MRAGDSSAPTPPPQPAPAPPPRPGASNRPRSPGSASPRSIRWPCYWDLYAASELGYFREQGIDLEILYTTSPTRSAQVVVSGDVELGTVGADTVIESITKGAELRIVAGGARQPNFTLMAQPTVQQYGDLRGKTLAVAGPSARRRGVPQEAAGEPQPAAQRL